MKKLLAASMITATLLALPITTLPVGALNNETTERGYISVSYTAEKEVAPDTVEISIAVRTEDSRSMSEASLKNKEISDKIYAYLKSYITPSNGDYIKTSNYSAHPTYRYVNGKRIFEKYEVSNNIIVHTKTIDKISTLIDRSITLGATNIDSLNFSLSEKDNYCADLLSNATKKAKERANVVATSIGSSVNGIRNIDAACTLNRYGMSYARNSLMKSAGAAMDGAVMEEAAPNIEPGVIKVYSNINASFYVKWQNNGHP